MWTIFNVSAVLALNVTALPSHTNTLQVPQTCCVLDNSDPEFPSPTDEAACQTESNLPYITDATTYTALHPEVMLKHIRMEFFFLLTTTTFRTLLLTKNTFTLDCYTNVECKNVAY